MKKKKVVFNDWLKAEMKDKAFRKAFDAEDIRVRLALLIAERRRKAGVSQAELARRLHTRQQVVSDIETLRHPNITILKLDKIARALNSRLNISFR
ncbi:MAG: Transcriptional regulator XRE family [Elusimicrobia bacterium]|nr:MAG: Transcriptional regulator XRE family [Elusimicrobiota bacterium]KAF0154817.1 MAG: Transcriptional regulator XRE family [Elusimicrobiota bacterium]